MQWLERWLYRQIQTQVRQEIEEQFRQAKLTTPAMVERAKAAIPTREPRQFNYEHRQ